MIPFVYVCDKDLFKRLLRYIEELYLLWEVVFKAVFNHVHLLTKRKQLSFKSGVGNLFTITGRMNCALSLAGAKSTSFICIHYLSNDKKVSIIFILWATSAVGCDLCHHASKCRWLWFVLPWLNVFTILMVWSDVDICCTICAKKKASLLFYLVEH